MTDLTIIPAILNLSEPSWRKVKKLRAAYTLAIEGLSSWIACENPHCENGEVFIEDEVKPCMICNAPKDLN